MALIWFLAYLLPGQQASLDTVEIVKYSTLDLRPKVTVGQAFATYRWFATGAWDFTPQEDGKTLVSFRGEWPEKPAAEDFHKRFKHHLKMSLMAMQMEKTYHFDEAKDRLAFVVDFEVDQEGNFSVVSGRLGIRNTQTQAWREEPLTDKALVRVIEAIYDDQNPYVALCQGLPYQ